MRTSMQGTRVQGSFIQGADIERPGIPGTAIHRTVIRGTDIRGTDSHGPDSQSMGSGRTGMQGGAMPRPGVGGPPRGQDDNAGTWIAFLVIAFGVLGLVGAFSVFAAQIPFERALARNIALDHALAVAGEPDGADKLEAMRPLLGDSAERIIIAKPGVSGPGMVQRVADERARMLTAFGRESEDIGVRLRIVIAVFTVACAAFGVAVLSILRRAR